MDVRGNQGVSTGGPTFNAPDGIDPIWVDAPFPDPGRMIRPVRERGRRRPIRPSLIQPRDIMGELGRGAVIVPEL